MTKKEMLKELEKNMWSDELKEDSSYEEVKEAYEGMRSELDDDSDMFPNGRDHDAEDEDGV